MRLDGRMHLGVYSKVKGGLPSSGERIYVVRESSPPIEGNDRALESDCANGGGPSAVSERRYLVAARIAQKLRDAGFACEIGSLVSTDRAALLSKH